MAISLKSHEDRLNKNRVVLLNNNSCDLWDNEEVKIYTFKNVNEYSDIIVGVSLNNVSVGANDVLEFVFTINLESLIHLPSKTTNLIYSWYGVLNDYEWIRLFYRDGSIYLKSKLVGKYANSFKHLYGILKLYYNFSYNKLVQFLSHLNINFGGERR